MWDFNTPVNSLGEYASDGRSEWLDFDVRRNSSMVFVYSVMLFVQVNLARRR